MNALIPTAGDGLSMTSLEIAGLVEKRHDNVKRTIETLAERGTIRLPQIEEAEKINNLGLPQRTSVLKLRLNPEMTHWANLESGGPGTQRGGTQ